MGSPHDDALWYAQQAQRANQPPECDACHEPIEDWWSYCAMCGYHIAGGALRPLATGKGEKA